MELDQSTVEKRREVTSKSHLSFIDNKHSWNCRQNLNNATIDISMTNNTTTDNSTTDNLTTQHRDKSLLRCLLSMKYSITFCYATIIPSMLRKILFIYFSIFSFGT